MLNGGDGGVGGRSGSLLRPRSEVTAQTHLPLTQKFQALRHVPPIKLER
jgi:hypothetical protein